MNLAQYKYGMTILIYNLIDNGMSPDVKFQSFCLPLFSYSHIRFDNILLVIVLPLPASSFSFPANHFNMLLSIVMLLSMCVPSTNAALHGQSIRT